ncbi:MAG: GMC family oxidoreductase [Chloroflexota bacterium]|nr:GMC family oxidoreductase [Chloroflexota bacterium]
MPDSLSLPPYADTVIIGGGTAGAVVAGLLAGQSDESILILEAGPDYGPVNSGRWPEVFLDARLGYDNAWGYDSGDTYPDRLVPFERARVIGGCSSHNGCAAIWGSRLDYDNWVALGNPGWSADELLPLFREADRRLNVRRYGPAEITPFQQACLDAAHAIGIPRAADLNDLDDDVGIAPSPANIRDGIRWNTAFGFLDPVRERPNLLIRDNVVVDRLVVADDRVTGVVAIAAEGPQTIAAGRVVLAAGTYGSPPILLRSGIGDPDQLAALGVEPVLSLPGVGANLHDHSQLNVTFSGTPELVEQMTAFAEQQWMPGEQDIAKLRSAPYPADAPGFDLHIWPVGGRDPHDREAWLWLLPVSCMTPRSRGRLWLTTTDPAASPLIDHGDLSDPEKSDRAVLIDGVRIAREMASKSPLRELLGKEMAPGSAVESPAELERWAEANVVHYYHPVGTCAMGPAGDPAAVVDARGRVHGLTNAVIADCSIMPVIPRANTNLPAVVVGMRVAQWLLAKS